MFGILFPKYKYTVKIEKKRKEKVIQGRHSPVTASDHTNTLTCS